jgi:PIN domain nuclease of toxin-antitoxin system
VRLLLDTHIWLWSLLQPERLGRHLRLELANPRNELWLSPISSWEVLLLNAKGRLRINDQVAEWLGRATAPFREAPLTHDIVVVSYQLPLPHRDPADRFLAATAQVLDLTLVTADERLLGLGDIATLANR